MNIIVCLSIIFLLLFAVMTWIAMMAAFHKFQWIIIPPNTMRKFAGNMCSRPECRKVLLMALIIMLFIISFAGAKYVGLKSMDVLCDWGVLLVAMFNRIIFKVFALMKENFALGVTVKVIAILVGVLGFPLTSLSILMLSVFTVFLPSCAINPSVIENKDVDDNTVLMLYFY